MNMSEDEVKQRIREINQRVAYIDHENDTAILEHMISTVQSMVLNGQRPASSTEEFQRELTERMNVIEIDSLLDEPADVKIVQAALQELPRLVTIAVFA